MKNTRTSKTLLHVAGALIFCTPLQSQTTPPPPLQDLGWPRQTAANGATLTYYQPQVESWSNYKNMEGRMAFALQPKSGQPIMGVASVTCNTIVDKDTRTAYLRDVTYTDVRFPSLQGDSVQLMGNLFRQLAPTGGDPVAVDRLLADMHQHEPQAQGVALNNEPPTIFYSAGPAILLMVEGEPVYAPIEKTGLQFVVNTNWDLFQEKKKKDYFLLVDKNWYTANDLKGPWTYTQALPEDMSKLPAGQNFDEVKKLVPPPPPAGTNPQIFFSDKPAELIQLKGAPVYSKIPGTQLLYIANTDNDIFLDQSTNTYYVLFSGRWFSAAGFEGPWHFTSDKLPTDFSKIPAGSPKATVLSSVPGTLEAADAVMLAQIPTTAIVNKAEVESKVKVTYDGAPQFKPIDQTNLQYASNTQDKVIKVGDLYYCCFQAVWFKSTTPNGPWSVADEVPKEIYTIPPGSPVYNVTYVTQTNPTSTTIESSYTSGYLGMFIFGAALGACLAFGTGWYYPPYIWWGPGMLYPIYRPWPCTYGIGAVYNPWTGGFAAGRAVYGPYGAARTAAWYNPATGRYGRSASVQGWYGGRTAASTYNPWTGGYGATRQGHNAYAQWGNSVASRGNQWVQTGHISTANGTAFGYRTSTGQHGVINTGPRGNTVAHTTNGTYAGHDGNIYRKNAQGNWSQYTHGSWQQPVGTSQHTMGGLDRSAQARQRGQVQTQRFQQHRGSFGGGGARGGFRRR
ncbi:hypothetical protein [Paraflavitalea sp. CAU 1676]|uniref:hypothetical protein n=1 Tax=Paraflavitalea sp. CAU 1676 TaxID=3032598 RepID=UPI0023DA1835|nr:hypothetical protein [Paraflavitalea sp. CAU 1676]MDF2191589.1 hypothetical protein [Paraflavitalea sp. CAU 1676]